MRQLNVFKQGRIKAEPIPKDTYKSKNTLRPEQIPYKYCKNFSETPTIMPVIIKNSKNNNDEVKE